MATNVGALELSISAVGAAGAVREIERVDAAAAKAGARPIAVNAAPAALSLRALGADSAKALASIDKLAGGNLTSITRRVQLLGDGMRSVNTRAASLSAITRIEASLRSALTSTNLTLSQRIALERQLAATERTRASGSIGSILRDRVSNITGPAGSILGGLGIAVGVGAAVGGLVSVVRGAIDASMAFTTSLRVLAATSRLTGVPLGMLQRTSEGLQRALGVTATNANTMTATAVRFTAAAGRANDTGRFLTAWLDLAASRGMTAADAMQALETTLAGNDEGLNRLGLRNPGEIFKAWGAGADDASRKSAILNEVLQVGASATGQFAERMNSAEGSTERLTTAKQNFLVTLGQAIVGGTGYTGVLGAMTAMVERATDWVSSHREMIRGWVDDLASLARGIGSIANLFVRFGANLDYTNAQLQVAAAWTRRVSEPEAYRAALANLASAREAYLDPGAADRRRTAAENARANDPLAERMEIEDARAAARGVGTGTGAGTRGSGRGGGGASGSAPFRPLLAGGPAGIANTMGVGGAATPVLMPVRLAPVLVNVPESIRALQQRVQSFASAVGRTIANSITAGFGAAFTRAFQGGNVLSAIGAGFQALTGSLLSGIGGAMVEFGEAALMASTLMQAIQTALNSLLPGGGIVASLAMIAIGSSLQAAAGAFGPGGGRGRRGGGGGGGSFSAPGAGGDVFRGVVLSPRAAPVGGQMAPTGRASAPATAQPIVNNFTVIGQNDPTAQRQIANMVASAARRGIA